MKDLKQWLTWATTETHVPAEERAARMSGNLSDHAHDIVYLAACHLTHHGRGDDFAESWEDVDWCLTHHPEAFRDLCLSFAEAVERMREVVPEAETDPRGQGVGSSPCKHPDGYYCHRCEPTCGVTLIHTHGPGTLAEWADEVARVSALPGRITAPRGVLELGPGAVPSRECADRFRGITGYDWKIMGERDHWYPWDTLRYLVEDVLAPGGGRITAEDERLHGLTWWPRRPG